MADNAEVLREVGRMMTDALARQAEIHQEREEANAERLSQLIERQLNIHMRDADKLTEQFEKLRVDKEKERGRLVHTLSKYDGGNYEFNEWIEKTEAVMVGNFWDIKKLLGIYFQS